MIVRDLLLSLLLCVTSAQADILPGGLIKLDGRPAPALKLADLDGKTTDLALLRGQWVMVHFWASWCGPCRRELPAIAAMAQTKPAALALVMVNTAETDDEVFAFLASVAPTLSTLLDIDGQVTERWQPRGLPSTFFVDPRGRLRYLALGGRPWDSGPYRRFLVGLAPEKRK
ncbi:MAG: TlpA family protein disulfide reductase [Sulfuricaulis sp.]|nr:TlpA family protein disulfide reductase [Sulfuricaulis sp.]